MRRRLPPKGGNRKILSAILAAVTSMSPVMTYAAEVAEPPSDMIEMTVAPQVTIKKTEYRYNFWWVCNIKPGA